MTTLLVGIAGTLGVLARYGISRLTLHSRALIWSTVGTNIAGSFLLDSSPRSTGSIVTCARRSG